MTDSPRPAAPLDRPWPEFWRGVGLGFGAALLVAVALGHLFGVGLPF